MNQALRYRRRDNPHVEPERPIAQVVQIVFDASLHLLDLIGFSSESVDLRPSCDPRLDPIPVDVAAHHFLVELIVLNRMRPRAYYRHIAT